MLRLPALVRRRAVAAFAGVLGTVASLAPAAGASECAECMTPALPRSVGFADVRGPSGVVHAAPVLRSHALPAPGPAVVGASYGPAFVPPQPFPYYNGPRRLSGVPAYRPFGLPMLSEVGAAIGYGVGAVGAGVGALADDILLGPVTADACGPAPLGAYPPPPCSIPRLNFRPLAAGCGPACPPPIAPPCPLRRPAFAPPSCVAPAPLCAAPVCPPPACAAPICPPPACAAPICPPVCAAPPVCETELVPQTTTKYARRECVTWKEVECVAYRNCKEEYVEPVCRTECRTVDRGCWKQVWVPNLVTEQYTTTDYVRRCRVRRVPYTYTKQVAERCEKLVPYCATTYVPRPVSACLPEPDCGAPDFAPRYAPAGPMIEGAPGAYYGADATGLPGYENVPGAGVPDVEYMSPDASSSLRPIPEDNFQGDAPAGNGGTPPNWNPQSSEGDRTSFAPQIPGRTAARGWAEQAPMAQTY